MSIDKKYPNNINIVCVGNWNRKIFKPSWVAKEIFELEKGDKIDGLVDPEEMVFGFKTNQILFFPKDSSLEISIQNTRDEQAYPVAIKSLNNTFKLLPHTPIKGIGFNYKFDGLDSMFSSLIKEVDFNNNDFEITQTALSRNFDDFIMNLLINVDNQTLSTTINCHYKSIQIFPEDTISKHLCLISEIFNING